MQIDTDLCSLKTDSLTHTLEFATRADPNAEQTMMWTLKTTLDSLPPWWQRIDNNPDWQDGAFIGLAACYGLIALVAVVQLIRIQKRVPEYGWTTQKVKISLD